MTTMQIDRAVVEQALEALETGGWNMTTRAITALRAALAQRAEPQPMHPELRKMWEDHFDKCFRAIPVPEQAEPVERAMQDAVTTGMGIMRGGERIDPSTIYKPIEGVPV